MYELVQVSEKCYYINCPAKIGVYVADKDNVYLVDSGNDKDAGRKARQILDKNGWYIQGDRVNDKTGERTVWQFFPRFAYQKLFNVSLS